MGVHVTTVSKALKNHPGLPERTKARNRKTAAKMGYQANPFVSILMGYRARKLSPDARITIAFLVPDSNFLKTNPHSQLVFEGAQKRAEELGFALDVISIDGFAKRGERLSQVLDSRGIHGAILYAIPAGSLPEAIKWDNLALVANYDLPGITQVCPDYFANAYLACEKLWELGFR